MLYCPHTSTTTSTWLRRVKEGTMKSMRLRDSDQKQVWSDCLRIMKLIRTSQSFIFSSGNLEQTGNVFNVLRSNNQQRIKTLLLDCLAQIKLMVHVLDIVKK